MADVSSADVPVSSIEGDTASLLSTVSDEELSPLHVLTRVHVVCRAHAQLAELHHVALTIDAFLYRPQHYHKTLADAVADDNLHLLRRLLSDATTQGRSGGVSITAKHRLSVGLQVTKAARVAVKSQSSSPNFKRLLRCLHAFDPEAVGASEVFEAAAAVGDLELFKWLHTNCPFDPAIVNSSEVAASAGGNDHVHILEWLLANRWSPQSKFPLDQVVKNNRREVLTWLDEHRCENDDEAPVSLYIGPGVIRDAAGRGDLDMFMWLFNHPRDESVTYAGDGAAANGHVHVLDWLFEFHPQEAQCYLDGYTDAARNGHLEVLQWLYAHYPKRFWTECMEAAGEAGQLVIVAFLHEHGDEDDRIEGATVLACSNGHFEVVKLLFELYPAECDHVIQLAGASGNLELFKWLHEIKGQDCTWANTINHTILNGHINVLEYIFAHLGQRDRSMVWTINNAAMGNRRHVMEWMHAKVLELDAMLPDPPQGFDRWHVNRDRIHSLPMTYAARNGNLEMLQWLVANGYSDCTTLVMDSAASRGHLDVVKWLHETRSEGCTTNAMDTAASNGHLAVVKWLHEHRSEGCTTDAVDLAVHNGHARVVEFLLSNRHEGCTSAAAHDAIEVRHDVELIHLLFTYHPDLIDLESVRAHADGNEAVLRWLRHVGGGDETSA